MSEDKIPLPKWAASVRRHSTRLVPRLAAMEGLESDSDSEGLDDDFMEDEIPTSQVHPHRFRFWGLAASPGDGCTAVLVTKHSTQHPHRRPRSKILFGQRGAAQETRTGKKTSLAKNLTTEGRLWEAWYGKQGHAPDIPPTETAASPIHQSRLRDLFEDMAAKQHCAYCESPLRMSGQETICESGHSFGESPSGALM